jgi:hypothetical protein
MGLGFGGMDKTLNRRKKSSDFNLGKIYCSLFSLDHSNANK